MYVLKDCGEESWEQSYTWHDEGQASREAADSFALTVARASRVI
jgi:hypothetical protein